MAEPSNYKQDNVIEVPSMNMLKYIQNWLSALLQQMSSKEKKVKKQRILFPL